MESNVSSLSWEKWDSVWEGVMRSDQLAWQDVQGLDVIGRSMARTAAIGPLPREAFFGLYGHLSRLSSNPPELLRMVHALMRRASELPEWQGLKAEIDEDAVAAAFGAAHFSLHLAEELPEEVQAVLSRSAQSARDESEQRNGLEELESLLDGMQGQPNGDILHEAIETRRALLEQAQAESRAALRSAEEILARSSARIARSSVQSLSRASQDLEDLKEAARAFGVGWGTGAGSASRQEIEALGRLSGLLSSSAPLRQLLKELGWARRLVAGEVRKSQQGRESFTHYQVGELNPEDLAPEEWVPLLLNDPASPLALDFWARALDDDLIHRRYEGVERAGRGPIVFVRDTSGSMQSPPARNALAAAVELALMQWALAEQRRFIAIPFSGPGQYSVYDPGARPDLGALLEHLTFGYWGGTEPYRPLEKAVEIIRTDPRFKQGDILILTDGAFRQAKGDFLHVLSAARAQPGLRVVAVVIGAEAGAAGFADRVVLLGDLVRDRERLAQAIGAIVKP